MTTPLRFGPYDVSRFVDGVYKAPVGHLIHRQGADALAAALAGHEGEKVDMDVNCFVLSGPDGISLIDTGCGTARGPTYGHARAGMIAAGIQPDDVSRVILTHIHGDHALGLIEGDRPYFPNADIWVPEADLAFSPARMRARHCRLRGRALSILPPGCSTFVGPCCGQSQLAGLPRVWKQSPCPAIRPPYRLSHR